MGVSALKHSRLYLFLWRILNACLGLLVAGLDRWVRKDPEQWVFAVYYPTHWSGNMRIVYEQTPPAKRRTIIHSRTLSPKLTGNPHLVYGKSWLGLWRLLRASVIFIQYSRSDYYWPGITCHGRQIINLWHGSPVKGIGFTAPTHLSRRELQRLYQESQHYSLFLTASQSERLAISSSLGVPHACTRALGLPRNDFLGWESHALPADLQADEQRLLAELQGRKLILYAPTFRNQEGGTYAFSAQELEQLNAWLAISGYCLGIREHMNRASKAYYDSPHILALHNEKYEEVQILLRQTALLITDYSGIWLDALLLDIPIVGFFYDWDDYMHSRALIYDFTSLFPGPHSHHFAELLQILTDQQVSSQTPHYQWVKNLMHSHRDFRATERLLAYLARS